MTTTYYEERLRAFAEGKRLGRLAKAVRDPEDGVCDACGSALPRTLFGLRDTASGRDYFVGRNCLSWLLEMGLVARARYRQSAEVAYRREMEMRNGANPADPESAPRVGTRTGLIDQVADRPVLRRTVLISESSSYYHVLARLDDGQHRASARAREPRWRLERARHDGGVVLEPIRRPRRAALLACVLKAYGQALARWRRDASPDKNGSNDDRIHEEVKA